YDICINIKDNKNKDGNMGNEYNNTNYTDKDTVSNNTDIFRYKINRNDYREIKEFIRESEDINKIKGIFIEEYKLDDIVDKILSSIYTEDGKICNFLNDKDLTLKIKNKINKIIESRYLEDIKNKLNKKREREIYDGVVNYVLNNYNNNNNICVGIAEYSYDIKITVINYNLEILEQLSIKKKSFLDNIRIIIEKYNNNLNGKSNMVFGITGTTNNIKFIKKLTEETVNVNISYVEYMDVEDLSYYCALRMSVPELIVYKILNNELSYRYFNKNIINTSKNEGENIYTSIYNNAIRKGLLTALSIIGIDINRAINSRLYRNILNIIIPSNFIEDIISYGYIEKLSDIEKIISLGDTKNKNLLSFLRIYDYDNNKNYEILDGTLLHPNDYDVIRMICAATVGEDEIDENNPSKRVKEIMYGDLTEILQMVENDANLNRCIHYTCYKRNIISNDNENNNISEKQMAESIIGLVYGEYKGIVTKKVEGYITVTVYEKGRQSGIKIEGYLTNEDNTLPKRNVCTSDNKFLVSVRLSEDRYTINDEVNLKIISQNGFFIAGEIIEKETLDKKYKYKESILYYKNYNNTNIKFISQLLNKDNPVIIRDSKTNNTAVIMILLDDNIISIKLLEDKDIIIEEHK
ncbi:hypothetical protein SLOPH_1216, partial [Spraguea lophii 42_110]